MIYNTKMECVRADLEGALEKVTARHLLGCDHCRINAREANETGHDVILNITNANQCHILAVCHDECHIIRHMTKQIKARLEYLRGELEAERMSYGELAELQSLVEYIEPDDVQLLEAAGVPEFNE